MKHHLTKSTSNAIYFLLITSILTTYSCKKENQQNVYQNPPKRIQKYVSKNSPISLKKGYKDVEYGTYPASSFSEQYYGAIATDYLWPQGTVITASFVDKTPNDLEKRQKQQRVKDIIQKCAHEWTQHANIEIKFIDDRNSKAMLRITIAEINEENILGYSPLGNSLMHAEHQSNPMAHNMLISAYYSDGKLRKCNQCITDPNKDHLHPSQAHDSIENIALHEFGHLLGLEHMHDHPDAPFCSATFKKEYGIHDDHHHSNDHVQFGAYDPESTMLYYVKKDWHDNKKASGSHGKLSKGDIETIKYMYPRKSV